MGSVNKATGKQANINKQPGGPQKFVIPTDTLFSNQWHLLNDNAGETDLNVTSVWDDYTGDGIKVAVIDDGFDHAHSDLSLNYDTAADHDFGQGDNDAAPVWSGTANDDDHGTAVMGLIGAAVNGTGTVGVAYDAALLGYRVDFTTTTSSFYAQLSAAITRAGLFADVANMSLGIGDFPNAVASVATALDDGTANGRGGLGTNYVAAGGNNRSLTAASSLDINGDSLSNSPYTITVGAVDADGSVSSYSSPGAPLLVSAFGSPSDIWTTDRTGTEGYSGTDHTGSFNGTSAAAPQVAGIVALMLEANSDLGWRDVQDILAYSANHTGSAVGAATSGSEFYQWSFNGADNWNGGGLHFSEDYGFGLVDAHDAVRLAETWHLQQTSANEVSAGVHDSTDYSIPDNDTTGITFTLDIASNIDIDNIALTFDINHSYYADLIVTLTSPSGTETYLLNTTGGGGGAVTWTLSSNEFRGEESEGVWTVNVADIVNLDTGSIQDTTLTVYGSAISSDDLYVYTDEFADYGGLAGRGTLSDTNGGIDTMNAAAVTTASILDLNAGNTSMIAGEEVTITAGTTIENAYGGDGDDTLFGNAADNILYGGRGDDLLDGGGGADTLEGGVGNDTIITGLGADIVDGGDGTDTVDYSASTNAQKISLVTNVNTGGYAHNDTLTSIENVIGANTRLDDITGTSGDNVLYGEAIGYSGPGADDRLRGYHGDDDLYGGARNDFLFGGTGADDLYGGDGLDWAMYNGASAAVTVDLVSGGTAGNALGDTYDSIERVRGSIYDDFIYGDDASNKVIGDGGSDELYGRGGRDNIRGGNGDDYLNGGTGNDGLRGDAGLDTYGFDLGSGHDFVIGFENNVDTLELDSALWGGGLTEQQVVDLYMTEQNDQRFFFDFGGGDILHVITDSAMNIADFYDDLTIV